MQFKQIPLKWRKVREAWPGECRLEAKAKIGKTGNEFLIRTFFDTGVYSLLVRKENTTDERFLRIGIGLGSETSAKYKAAELLRYLIGSTGTIQISFNPYPKAAIVESNNYTWVVSPGHHYVYDAVGKRLQDRDILTGDVSMRNEVSIEELGKTYARDVLAFYEPVGATKAEAISYLQS